MGEIHIAVKVVCNMKRKKSKIKWVNVKILVIYEIL